MKSVFVVVVIVVGGGRGGIREFYSFSTYDSSWYIVGIHKFIY